MESEKGDTDAEQPNNSTPESSEIISAQQPESMAKSVMSFFIRQPESLAKSVTSFFRRQYEAFVEFDKEFQKTFQEKEDRRYKSDCDKFFREIYEGVYTTLKARGGPLSQSEMEELAELKELHKLMRESESKQLKHLMIDHRWVIMNGKEKKLVCRCRPHHQFYLNLYNQAKEFEDLLNKNKTQTKK